MANIREKYERREDSYNKLLKKQQKAERDISYIRLLVFIIGVNIGIYTYRINNRILLAGSIIAFISVFSYLVRIHKRLKERIKYTSLLIEINIMSIKRLEGKWDSFKDDGKDFKDDSHKYLLDLDIFGHKSLFQWINTASTFYGRHELKRILSEVVGDRKDIEERQVAVDELSRLLNWRQRFITEGILVTNRIKDPEELIAWANEVNEAYRNPYIIGAVRLLPCITVTLIILGFAMRTIPSYYPSLALFIQFLIIMLKGKERHDLFNLSEKYNKDLGTYYNMLRLIENHRFTSPYIERVKNSIKNDKGQKAYKQIELLSSIVGSIANRKNSFYIIFNTIALWDLQILIKLEGWKQRSGRYLEDWLKAIGIIESLASLAVIRHDNPDWVVPTIVSDGDALLEAKELGHPLISNNKVSNNLSINNNSKVLLITGSNMSGKSTLLRTAGINLVLAYAGAPVCARAFKASIMDIYTCMRVTDNLSENISSFYAELLRIKNIVKEAESGKRIFFLLDEIFKGTNSLDRHTGASVLINKLSHTNSIGMVSTHDLELSDLEKQNQNIVNYHFQEYYKEDKIYFDYKLRPGSSTTRNALFLMKLAGIDVE